MNKKKLFGMLVALVLVAALGIGATLAYFTDTTNTLTNVVAMGKVQGFLAENEVEQNEETKLYELDETKAPTKEGIDDYKGVMPGDKVEKNPTVILEADSADAFVRVKLQVNGGEGLAAADLTLIENVIKAEIAKNPKWVASNGYYYYDTELTAPSAADLATTDYVGTLTEAIDKATLFGEFTLPLELSNLAASKGFSIVVDCDLIQADNIKFVNDNGVVGWFADTDTNNADQITTVEDYEAVVSDAQ